MRKLIIMHPAEIDNGFYSSAVPQDLLELEFYDANKNYGIDAAFLYDWFLSPWKHQVEQELRSGRQIIIDFKTEHFFFVPNEPYLKLLSQYPNQHLFLISANGSGVVDGINVSAVPNWFWWEMQRNYKQHGLDKHVPAPTHQKKFFCQIRGARRWRDLFLEKITPLLDQSLYSYVEKGIYLPGDMPNDFEHGPSNFQRHVNVNWYNNTDFTLTVESSALPFNAEPYYVKLVKNHGVFLSEKSYKPLGMLHPFMIVGQQHTLKCIRQSGFETFPELWDESYDDEINFYKRIELIMKNIKQFDFRTLSNPVVQEKLHFNRNRFFDKNIVDQKMKQQIIDPILKFLNIQ